MSIRLPVAAALALLLSAAYAANDYPLTSDSLPQDGVPKGELVDGTYRAGTNSLFPGTTRPYTLYLPAGLDRAQAAALMVFQDGKGRANEWKVPVVFDNLIHRKELPPIIGVFVSPGVVEAASTNVLPRFNRSFEYDSMGDRYVRFLAEEFLPWVETTHGVKFTTNAAGRAIAGASSGAIAAFTAAWERPDRFSRVFSTIGTYVGLRGGNDYPTLVRKTEPKPLRVYLQDGANDLNIYGGNWWIANQDLLAALELAGYEVAHAWGDGGHDGKHGAAIFPDAMRWLWKDHPAPPKAGESKNAVLRQILIPGEGWKEVSSGHRFTEGPAVSAKGEVYFTDIPNNRIHKVGLDGRVSVFAEQTGGANGLVFGMDGLLYACANGNRQIVSYDPETGTLQVVLEDAPGNDAVSLARGGGYFTDPDNRRVWFLSHEGERKLVDTGIAFPNGVVTSPDQSLLYVSDTRSQWVYSFVIQPDGALSYRQPYFHLHIPDPAVDSGADGMTTDTEGRLYVATRMGVQICDQAGRVNAILDRPQRAWLSNVVFGGADRDELYATCGDKVFKRKLRAKGVAPFEPPLRPASPRL